MKLICDHVRPQCGRCARLSDRCDYPQSRKADVGRRKQILELQTKVHELERLATTWNNAVTGLTAVQLAMDMRHRASDSAAVK
ncbi:Putative zn(2)Cys(6) fungal-type DNA-binding domain-containing protein [Colletotrichum destructivum]|uniref:Zn(2)Cys(6) fungal-type DNA-binding domain-containing protein n=1 Tax=Colletotrichum destructivum TaxID=34406 RepID=A0AAX4I5C0_9PEZI|nr:Putative zn(2)Cys(6) fungal-type DNA-binding domain-containing protein [Colletotrichum destructivum]